MALPKLKPEPRSKRQRFILELLSGGGKDAKQIQDAWNDHSAINSTLKAINIGLHAMVERGLIVCRQREGEKFYYLP